ncbi:VOC family protein [Pendulispora brunnea]|uniref:VOC family protein n=1 Tax=Pendulispora brunnea TaxID=2905690 RepID=A0ABZ2JYR2_9BACT
MTQRHKDRQINFIELPARDVAASKKFYSAIFGWTYQDYGDDYADICDAGISAGLNGEPDSAAKKPLVIMYSSNLEDARARVVKAGGKITKDIFSFPGGRRFHFTDPSGNELAIWSDAGIE